MKSAEKYEAIQLRMQGRSINNIASTLGVAKSSVSLWTRHIVLNSTQLLELSHAPYTNIAVEKRRIARLQNEDAKRHAIIERARNEMSGSISEREQWLIGTMLYWAEGGKTRRLVRFSNGDPDMIKVMMQYFRRICKVDESKFRGHIHIHHHLDYIHAENYWSGISKIPKDQFFKSYRRQAPNIHSKNSLPNGVMDIYVLDTRFFLQIKGWIQGIFQSIEQDDNISVDARVVKR